MQGIFDKKIEPERARETIDLLKIHSEANELWRNLGDDGVRKAAYRGG
jgi:hypothetical protein